MVRIAALGLLLSAVLLAQEGAQGDKQLQTRPPDQGKPQRQEQEPPEEDESLAPKTYSFNPLEADKDLKVGLYYFKKGNYKAAMSRFREATLWNPTYAEAFLRLGESAEKLKDKKAAHEAYEKYVALAPNEKQAEAIKKKLASQR
ncbi:MAG: tetratricopeptide repeat protein [Bryobacteraceae bacterium]